MLIVQIDADVVLKQSFYRLNKIFPCWIFRTGVVSSGLRQMADKSTRTDENLLNGNGDQQQGGSSRNSQQTQTQQPLTGCGGGGNNGGYRKSVTSQGGGSKSPIPGKRGGGVHPFSTVSMGVGPDVPYTSTSSYASPSKSSPRGASSSFSSTVNSKTPHPSDNNRPGNVGPVTAIASSSSSQSHLSTTDKDAFPTPNFVKVPTTSAKPFSGVTDHNPKEVKTIFSYVLLYHYDTNFH